jgi:hypothetical protein
MYCCLIPSDVSRSASAKGAGQASDVQQVRGPLHEVRLGQSQLAMGPLHIDGLMPAMATAEGAVTFIPFSKPCARPVITDAVCGDVIVTTQCDSLPARSAASNNDRSSGVARVIVGKSEIFEARDESSKIGKSENRKIKRAGSSQLVTTRTEQKQRTVVLCF